jgi:CheY-like chemotaxis protein
MVDGERPKILLVDDNAQVRETLARFLDVERYEALEAADGQAALDLLRARGDIDVIVTDVQMPNVDGLQLARAVRRRWPSLPVVIISGLGREEVAIDALRAGATNYLRKPFRNAEFDLVIRQSLELAQGRRRRDEGHAYLLQSTKLFELPPDPAALPRVIPLLTQGLVELGVVGPQDLLHVEVALQEALLNAIVHGTLELTGQLPPDRAGLDEVCRERRLDPRYADRVVRAAVEVDRHGLQVVIEDQGAGFDPATPPGNGLFLMRSFMDDVIFEEGGRRVVLVRRRDSTKTARADE